MRNDANCGVFMKPKVKLLPTIVFALLFAGSHAQLRADPAVDLGALASANMDFAFKLERHLVRGEQGSNLFFSPYSLAASLQTIGNGAWSRTFLEMQQVLGTANLSIAQQNRANDLLEVALNHRRREGILLATANALWCGKETSFLPTFLTDCRQYYHAHVEALDFRDPRAVEVINHWVSEKTDGKINGVMQQPLDPDVRMLLVNAIYFKGRWAKPFEPSLTAPRAFHPQGLNPHPVSMMAQSGKFYYRRGTGFTAARLDYQGGAMYVFLPDPGSSPAELLNVLNGVRWREVTKPGFKLAEGLLEMPKLKLKRNVDLSETLKEMGMKTAFDSKSAADFSRISHQPLYLSQVRQSASLEIDEHGAEAAAATSTGLMSKSLEAPTKSFEMIVDRPYLFVIEDRPSGTFLFMGVVNDPTMENGG